MDNKINLENLLFYDPRLEFNGLFRFLWKLVFTSFYIIFSTAAVLFVVLDVFWLKWLGILSILFLIDRLIHINKAPQATTDLNAGMLNGVNCADYLSPRAYRAISRAFDRALTVGGDFHLYLMKEAVKEKGVRGALWRLEISPEDFEQKLDEEIVLAKNLSASEQKDLLEKTYFLIKQGFIIAFENKFHYIGLDNIFSALGFINEASVKKIFHLFSIEPKDVEKALIFARFRPRFRWLAFLVGIPKNLGGFARKSSKIRHRYMNRAWTARPTPALDKYSDDITDLARDREVGFLIGHEKEYKTLTDVLSRPTRPNVILIGEPGSGKESIVYHLAYDIVKDKVPEALFDKRLVSLQIGSLIMGAGPEEVSQRVNEVAREILSAKNVILYIPDIHNLIKTSGNNFINAADILLPAIRTEAVQVIGSTYPREFKENLESKGDFISAFEKINIEELSEDEAIKVLTYDAIVLEQHYKVIISFEAIKQSVVLAHKYFRQKLLPSSAEDILKEALADATQKNEKVLKTEAIIQVCERKINVPIHKATKAEAKGLLNLEDTIHQNLIDQQEAVKAVARSLREYRSGLGRSSGPIAAFLFVGPTGVGKTELSKILAKTQFGSEEMMVRFDMSEYQDKQSIFRFIGSPDGKIVGSLTEAVVQRPYSLVLLDEFEKANNDVLNLFLQVFDDGRLTDNLGRVVDFKNTIIIATSNALSDYIKESLEQGKAVADFKDEFKKKLAGFFRPELLNRFSDVIIFKNLSPDDILQITKLQLVKLAKTLAQNQGFSLEFSDEAVSHIAQLGYDPVFGARPLRGVISDKIKSVLAEKILREEVRKGETIKVTLEEGEIKFI